MSIHCIITTLGPEDMRLAEGGLECHFLRDVKILSSLHPCPPSCKEEPLSYLLHGFFEFYDEFDLKSHGFSLISGKSFVKPVQSALYIEVIGLSSEA